MAMAGRVPDPSRKDSAQGNMADFDDGKTIGIDAQGNNTIASRRQGTGMNEPAMKGTWQHIYPPGSTT